MTDPDPESVVDAVRDQEREDRDGAVAEELDVADQLAEALADNDDNDDDK